MNYRISNLLFVIFFVLLTACSGSPDIEIPEEIASLENLNVIEADADPIHSISLTPAASYGDTEDVIIGQMGQFSVDQSGRIYIADFSQNVIHAYESDGSYLRQIGREGDGPGEFRRVSAIRPGERHLHVLDTGSMRISRFTLDSHNFVDNLSVPFEFQSEGGFVSFPGNFHLVGDSYYLIHFGTGYSAAMDDSDVEPKDRGRLLNRSAGEFEEGFVYEFPISEAIVHREGTSMSVMSPEYKRRSITVVNNSRLAHGWSEELLFKFYDMDGAYQRAVWQPNENISLNRNEILQEYSDRDEPWRGMVRNDNMPERWPAYRHLVLDDENRIWAALYSDEEEMFNWRVFSEEGEFLAAFIWPESREIREVKNGSAYTRETDEETGLVEVVRYRVDFE
ncbi:6-bladed beta-propeller [Rhodohalobacter halophilus]|uniref:6-bladed beta-propeller n=1 Tax=Rhodohalobacter halophilus TaxID=1812810 RepID=UPI0015B6CA3F|nr:6-bladed beta-propeller [Rhodohalobacter halophilus]